MRLIILFFVQLIIAANLIAQKPPIKFGKIDGEDLQMTTYTPDPEAEAVVLCDYGSLNFQLTNDGQFYRFFRHRRVKILKEPGYGTGNVVLGIYKGNYREKISKLKATTYLPDGRKIDVDKKDFFEEEVNEYWSRLRFTFPALEPGAVIEFSYELLSHSIFTLQEWYFQENIPVRHSELFLEIPEYFDYIQVGQGNVPYPNTSFVETDMAVGTLGRIPVRVKRVSYVSQDVAAMREQPYITTMEDYLARVRFQLRQFKIPGITIENVLPSWHSLAQELMQRDDFGGRIKKQGNFDEVWSMAQPYLAEAASDEEKITGLYHFVNSNFRVEPGYRYFCRYRLNNYLKDKTAIRSELNIMLVALLRKAGLAAYPVLIGTRSHGHPVQSYPFVDQFNHVVAAVASDKGLIFMECGVGGLPVGMLHPESLNGQGWLVSDEKDQWVALPEGKSNNTYFINMEINDEGRLLGVISCSKSGYYALETRQALGTNPAKEPLRQLISTAFPEGQIDSIVYADQNTLNKPVKAKIYCQIGEAAMSSGEFIYVSPVLVTSFAESPFKSDSRLFPIEFPYPFGEKIIFNLTIPEGYEVAELPENVRMVVQGEGGSFQYQFSQTGNRLQLISNMEVTRLRFEPSAYETLRHFFTLIADKMAAQVVLRKA